MRHILTTLLINAILLIDCFADEKVNFEDVPLVTIVVASKHEDTSWVNNHLNQYNIVIYKPNDANQKYTSTYDKGYEVCMYLTYILDHYDKLSPHTIFLHGHQSSWHGRDMTTIIPRLKWSDIEYANLNVDYFQQQHSNHGFMNTSLIHIVVLNL
jgi:hypothetical protein